MAALPAGDAADHHHPGLLLLAVGTGDLAIGDLGGRLRRQHQVRLVRQFHPSLQRSQLLRLRAADAGLQFPGRVARPCHLPAAGRDGRPHHPRRLGLQDHPGLALCRRTGGRRRAVRLPVQSLGRRRRLGTGGDRPRVQLRDQRQPGASARGVRRRLEPDQLQLPVLPRRPAVDPQVADRGGGDRWRGPRQALLGHRLPVAVAHRFLPAGDQHHLRLLRHLRHCRVADPGRAGPGHQHPDLEGLQRRLPWPGPRRLLGAVGGRDGRGDRAHLRAVPLHRTAGPLLMVENRPFLTFLSHLTVIVGLLIIAFPVWMTFVASTHDQDTMLRSPVPIWPGSHMLENYWTVLVEGYKNRPGAVPLYVTLTNSMIMALGVAIGKILISIIAAFAIVYFRFPLRMFFFWAIFVTLMLPVEVRIVPTYGVVAGLGMLDSYSGLIIPLIASATATFLFRQFFLSVPDELTEAARVDGASPMRFFWDILLPMSRTSIAALFVIQFIYGWNQYLWPLLITTKESFYTVVMGVSRQANVVDAVPSWNLLMAMAMLAALPPVLVVVFMQRQFVRGLVETEK